MAKTSKKAAGDRPSPKCQALLLCEKAIIDQQTWRPSLINVFDMTRAEEFPYDAGPFFVFLQMAEGIGGYDIEIEFRDLVDGEVLARTPPTSVQFEDRLERINVVIEIRSLFVEHAGVYDVVALASGEDFGRQRLQVNEVDDEDESNE